MERTLPERLAADKPQLTEAAARPPDSHPWHGARRTVIVASSDFVIHKDAHRKRNFNFAARAPRRRLFRQEI
jgi:hypothetical protein